MNEHNSALPVTLDEAFSRYHTHLGKLASRTMALKVKDGGFPGCAPVGYLNTRVHGESGIIVDPKLAPLVQEAFNLAVSRKYSLRKIVEELTPKGLVSRNGKAMGPSALMNILRNPFYTGKIRYEGKILPGKHVPLINTQLFESVQVALGQRRRRSEGSR